MSVKAILTEQQKSYTKAEEDALLATKQNTLTFDTTPTASSTNPVTSGGIATALDGRLPSPENAGAVGQVLTKTATGSVWQTQSSGGDIVAAASNSYAVTLYAASWSSQQQTIATPTGAEITSTSDGVLGLAADATQAQVEAFQLAKIVVVSQSSSGVVVKAYGIVPTINLPCELMLFMKADYYNKDYIDTYMAPLDTPTFIGVPKAPTAAAGTNTTQIATTAFVEQAKNTRVPLYGLGKNLLRNWDFHINQRNIASGEAIPANYNPADGWIRGLGQGTCTRNSDGTITLDASDGAVGLIQYLDPELVNSLVGSRVTMSILTTTGELFTVTVYVLADRENYGYIGGGNSSFLDFDTRSINHRFAIGVDGGDVFTIKCVKLEVGMEQTLCYNGGTEANPVWILSEAPNYEYELYRCMTSTANSNDTYANKSLATEQELAYVENGTTASRAYAVGEYFCWHGSLYKAKTAIGSGDAFTVNTNCEQVPAGGLNDVVPVSGEKYCKLPDGTLIQWGNATIASGTDSVSVTYPVPFVGIGTTRSVTANLYDTYDPSLTVRIYGLASTTTFALYTTGNTTANRSAYWIAVGKWK